MTFERLDSIVMRVLSRVDGLGELEVGASARPTKNAEAEAPASDQGNVIQRAERKMAPLSASPPRIGRDRRTGEQPLLGHAPAPLVRRSMLTVVSDNGPHHVRTSRSSVKLLALA